MDTMQPLYDLAPLARMMLMGVVVALGPLVWVWRRNRGATPVKRLHALTLVTLFLTFDLVLFGAFTRLTDSGLGCPDWPGCYGNASPVGAHADIAAAQSAMPTGPVTHGKAWVEMVHRYLATGVGVLILMLTTATWFGPKAASGRRVNPWWPTATLAWVCLQGAFGALTVTMKLFPAIVTLHLLGGLALLALLCVQVAQQALLDRTQVAVSMTPGLRWFLWACLALLTLQIALGGWVSTNYAVLACNEFPMCQGRWWPEMNFEQGFQLWRALGMTQDGASISFAALTAIHVLHRSMAAVVLTALGALAWCLNKVDGLRSPSRWLAMLLILQLATGLANVVFNWPLVAAVLHTGGAAALVVLVTWALAVSRAAPNATFATQAAQVADSRLPV
jgi:cytochrome c oxidase assembly protein subunit 15